jgi:rare lipoprotein A
MIASKFSTVFFALLCTAAIGTDAHPGLTQQQPAAATTAIASNPGKPQNVALKPDATSVVKIYNHQIQGQPAATLYVRNLPILTFLDAPATAPSANPAATLVSTAATENSRPSLSKAEAIANQLNEIYRSGGAADGIKVVWQADKTAKTGQYVVKAGKLPIATIDASTTYAKTTSNAEQDALLVANKLRRLLSSGDAAQPIKQVEGKPKAAAASADGAWNATQTYRGEASWYGPGFDGNLTANGERFNQNDLTAAHPSLPFGTKIRVTNQYNGRSVVVRVNDRGPYAGGRIIDLSAGSADVIGLTASGVAPVALEVLSR